MNEIEAKYVLDIPKGSFSSYESYLAKTQFCRGYLEAIQKAEVLVEALKHCGDTWAEEALAKWEKMK